MFLPRSATPPACRRYALPNALLRSLVCAVMNVRSLTSIVQGGYLDMSAFIAEQGFKTGKGGYQKVRPAAAFVRCAAVPTIRLTRSPRRCSHSAHSEFQTLSAISRGPTTRTLRTSNEANNCLTTVRAQTVLPVPQSAQSAPVSRLCRNSIARFCSSVSCSGVFKVCHGLS